MKILFANPPWWEFGATGQVARGGIRAGSRWPFTRPAPFAPDNFRFGSYIPFPFFLASAAAWVKTFIPGSEVELRDSIARGESYETFFRYVFDAKPDFLIIETGAASWPHDLELVKVLKNRITGLQVAIAGPTAAEASKNTIPGIVDAWLVGEYEKNAAKFINGARGKIDFDLLSREELKAMPFPMFDEKCALNYWDACPKGQIAPHLQLYASRGCVFKCVFCSFPATMTADDPDGTKPRSVRHYAADWIEQFIRARIAINPAIRSIYFDDDWFNNSKIHVLEICSVMKRIGLPWTAMCRSDTSDDETWLAMRDSGCKGVKVGFESGSQRVVDQIVNKRLNIEEGIARCIWLRGIGLSVHTTWTVGLPGETADEQQLTVDTIAKLYQIGAHDTHQLSGTASIPGTPLDLVEHGVALKKFPGAKTDAGYESSPDGNKKLEGMK